MMKANTKQWVVKNAIGWYFNSWSLAEHFMCRACGDRVAHAAKIDNHFIGVVRAIYEPDFNMVACERCGSELVGLAREDKYADEAGHSQRGGTDDYEMG